VRRACSRWRSTSSSRANFNAALDYATAAARKAPLLNDYAQYVRAQAEYKLKNYPEVSKAATQVFNQDPVSPLLGPAAVLAVNADLDNDNPKHAFELVKKYFDRIPQPQATLLLARAVSGERRSSAGGRILPARVLRLPGRQGSCRCRECVSQLESAFARHVSARDARRYVGARRKNVQAKRPTDAATELAAAIPQLGGAQRDLARVRLGEADFFAGKAQPLFEYLTALKVDDPEADAERLSYLIRSTRKLNRDADVKPFLDQPRAAAPTSSWRLDALLLTADEARTRNDVSTYLPLYRACARVSPRIPKPPGATGAWLSRVIVRMPPIPSICCAPTSSDSPPLPMSRTRFIF